MHGNYRQSGSVCNNKWYLSMGDEKETMRHHGGGDRA